MKVILAVITILVLVHNPAGTRPLQCHPSVGGSRAVANANTHRVRYTHAYTYYSLVGDTIYFKHAAEDR